MTIQREMFSNPQKNISSNAQFNSYSYQTSDNIEKIVDYNSDSEFSKLISGMKAFEAWEAMDAIMEILKQTYPKLYNYALIEIKKIK